MSSCKFPEHHGKPGAGSGLGVLAVLAAAAVVVYAAVRLVLVVVHFIEAWWWAFALVPAAAVVLAAAWTARLIIRCRSRCKSQREIRHSITDLPASKSVSRSRISVPWLRHLPRAVWAAARWHHLTRNLQLAYPDRHVRGKTRRPRAVILPTAHGVVARVRTVPGSGREEFDKAAGHFADAWRVQRVAVSQPKPGRLVVRGLRRDPLLEQLEVIPPGRGLRHLYLGRDEHGTDRYADLANVPGIVLGGMPGAGKSTEITSWLTQLALSPAVQFALADGKNAGEFDDFEGRAYVMAGDDLDEVIDLLEKQHTLMTDRLACVRQVLGVKNAWHVGPAGRWPLAVTILDECQSYLDLTAVKGDKQLEPKVRRCIFLTSSLIRRGRSVMMLTVLATQKPTTDSLPSSIRDNCPVALCFAVKTTEAAAATLGSSIREYPSYSPAGLALPDYTGVATVTLTTGKDPFTRLRGPWVSEDQAAAAAASNAKLRKDPRASLPVVVPDDLSSLATANDYDSKAASATTDEPSSS